MTGAGERFGPETFFTGRRFVAAFILLAVAGLVGGICGCGKSQTEKALSSDANGYLCRACSAKFYTDREVFANTCPNCKSTQLAQCVGFVCPDDKHVTVGPRGTGSTACEKCGKLTSGLSIPRESDFRSWGAAKKTKAEVGA